MNIYQIIPHPLAHAAVTNHRHVDDWRARLASQNPEIEPGQYRSESTICGRGLLYELLLAYGTEADFQSSLYVCETGRLILPGTDWYVSISHTAYWTAAAISKTPVGIDIEDRNRTNNWQVITEMMLPDSMKEVIWDSEPASRQEMFLRNWVRIEASAKINKGLVLPVAEADLTGETSPFETDNLIGCIVTGIYPISSCINHRNTANKNYPGAAYVC